MMRRGIAYQLFVISFMFLFCALCYAQPISSTELINNAKSYDGKIVVYEGEVIGDVMKRGDYAWVNVNDGKNAIGIWMKSSLAGEIGYTGSYKSIGDGVEITGVFNRACPEHGGDLDIHAQAIRKTGSGRMVQEKLNLDKINRVIILSIILIGLWCFKWILNLLKRK